MHLLRRDYLPEESSMTEDERRHIEQEITHLEHDRHFLSNAGKLARERLSCAMFLRALGVPFSDKELIAVPNDGPPDYIDVKIREARFQVLEIPDKGCRRQDDVEADIQRYKQALTQDLLFEDIVLIDRPPPRRPMSYSEVYARLSNALEEKASRYGQRAYAALDALGFIQLTSMYLDRASPLPDDTALRQQGWRSVSFVMPMYSHVVYATKAAPAFLLDYEGQTRQQWEDGNTFYRLS
jgi:hypothetical protein